MGRIDLPRGGSPGGSGAGGGDGSSDPALVCNAGPYPAVTSLHRLTVSQYQHAIADIFGPTVIASAQYPGSYGKSITGYSTEEGINEVGDQSTEQVMNAAEEVAQSIYPKLGALLPCSATTADSACAKSFLDTFATRAYRRPLTSDERAALMTTFGDATAAGATFTEAVAIMSAHLLQAPQFLYQVEDSAGAGRALTGYELASRLSFLLWDSVPDDELLALAADGTLEDPGTVAAQAQRMLASPKADSALARLLREWTATARLTPADKDVSVFPFFTQAYAKSMNDAFDRFSIDQLRTGTLTSLLTANVAFVDANLAAQYGLPAPTGGGWERAQVDGNRYAGVCTQPLLLATQSHPGTSSYVFRGRTVLKRLLAEAFPNPPANAQSTFSTFTFPTDPTGKDVSAVVRSNANCAGCHQQIDPPGLAFEHFDGLGKWRDSYDSGKAIDASGTMTLGSGALGFAGNVELAQKLAAAPELEQAVAVQLFRFTFSRMESAADACAIASVRTSLHDSGGDLGHALLAVTHTDAFSWRADP
ncbi:MAG: DUF1592 domain-containing protein [Myxococcaceae bacterium]